MHFRGRADRRSAHCAACPAWPGVRPRPRRAARARGTAAAATTAWAAPPIERGAREADAVTQRRRLAWCRDGRDGAHQSVSSMSRGFRGILRNGNFFLECDDCLRPLQLPLQPAVLGSCFTRGSTGRGVGHPGENRAWPAGRPPRAAAASSSRATRANRSNAAGRLHHRRDACTRRLP